MSNYLTAEQLVTAAEWVRERDPNVILDSGVYYHVKDLPDGTQACWGCLLGMAYMQHRQQLVTEDVNEMYTGWNEIIATLAISDEHEEGISGGFTDAARCVGVTEDLYEYGEDYRLGYLAAHAAGTELVRRGWVS